MRRLLIVHHDLATGLLLRDALENGTDLRVVHTDVYQRRASALLGELRPDLVVCSLRAQDGPVTGLLQTLSDPRMQHRAAVLLVTPSGVDPKLLDALRTGGESYWIESDGEAALVARAQQLLRGEADMTPAVARALLMQYRRDERMRPGSVHEMLDPLSLSGAERNVLATISEGKSVAEAAVEHFMSLRQVRSHVLGIYRKLQWERRAAPLTLAA